MCCLLSLSTGLCCDGDSRMSTGLCCDLRTVGCDIIYHIEDKYKIKNINEIQYISAGEVRNPGRALKRKIHVSTCVLCYTDNMFNLENKGSE